MNWLNKGIQMNRSEKLRQKRQPAAQTRSAVPSATTSRLAADRVVARRASPSAENRHSVGTQPRRKMVYSIGANGVETRLPALPILRFSWQWVSGILTILLLMFIIVLVNTPIFKVNSFEVHGLSTYSSADFNPLLNGRRDSIFLVNTNEIFDSILVAFPELVGSQVEIGLPNRIVITAAERKPVVLWHSSTGDYWIDAEGVILAPRGEGSGLLTIESASLPPLLVERHDPRNFTEYVTMVFERKERPSNPSERAAHIRPEVLEAALQMNSLLPQGATLLYDSVSGMGWRDPGGWEVYFGNDLSNIQMKLVMYQVILGRLQELGISPEMISVEHVDAPYYRME